MARVFQYGSNLSSERFNSEARLAGDARILSVVKTVERYELDFTVASIYHDCAAADIVPSATGRLIVGVLYEVPDYLVTRETARSHKRASLDEIEGEGAQYRRVEIQLIDLNDHIVKPPVITYIVNERQTGLRTNLEYVGHIIKGLREHGVNEDYVEYVLSRVLRNNPCLERELNELCATL